MNSDDELMEPGARTGHCMTSVGEYVILYGGHDESTSSVFNELSSYNTLRGIWRRYQPPSDPHQGFYSSSICANGKFVYIFGGLHSPDENEETNSLISFDIHNASWQTLSPHTEDCDQNTPPPMFRSCIFYHSGYLYIIGGVFDYSDSDKMHKFCLKTSKWSLVSQNGVKPLILGRIFGTVYNNQFHTFDFSRPNGQTRFRNICIFDLSTYTWTTRETSSLTGLYPDDRLFESFAFSGNLGYLSGGDSMGRYYSDIWRIDLEELQWCKLHYTLIKGICGHHTSIVDDSCLYSFGGFTDSFENLQLFQNFTLRPPSLYRLCLESIRRSPNFRRYAQLLPVAIVDELSLYNKNH
ncbi:Kelch domain-containing protein 10 [Thelohanellus kitauei]|uniref:Kelch domain-containing protein 10 n=1 Tax=Thelohanellus kitauei TaxID=669202 RepID=A0A0C2MN47_THEKT|nr:Kelch domain-containing protein 10 [Thelohanellus kitauei]